MESARNVISQIDTIKKAILARAFRCELGTNDLTEEAAIEVLKLILQKEWYQIIYESGNIVRYYCKKNIAVYQSTSNKIEGWTEARGGTNGW